jgi:hypothetical protein
MVYLNIFGGGVLTYVFGKSNTWILTSFLEMFFCKNSFHLYNYFSDRSFFPQENKCKVLEFIPHDLEGNWCKMMASI